MMKHEASEDHQMKASQRSGKPLIIAHQPSEAGGPGKGALHHPPPRQQDKAVLGLGQFDDFQWYAMLFGLLGWGIAGVGLVHKGEFDRLTGGLLHGLSQFAHLRTILLIGRGEKPRQQIAQGIDGGMHFAAKAKLGAIIARTAPTFGR